MFKTIQEKTLYIFGIANVITIPMVWALYPESNQRTLEEMDLLFAADTPWNWDAETKFKQLKEENPDIVHAAAHGRAVIDPETGKLAVPGGKSWEESVRVENEKALDGSL